MERKGIFITGHQGLVGSALLRLYQRWPEWEIIIKTRTELDLTDAPSVRQFFDSVRPRFVILAAAKMGGIKAAYTQPVEFLLENLKIQNSVIEAAYLAKTEKLLFLGSTCVYPKHSSPPIKENALLTGPMESTNEAYSVAKIAGIKLCQAYRTQYGCDFIVAMPANLYGPHDNFDPEHSHVLPSLISKFHEAKHRGLPTVTLWGTGTPRREFLYVDDLAEACAILLEKYSSGEIVNVGVGKDITIREIAEMVRDIVGYNGRIIWDTTQSDGNPQRLLDTTKINALGWKARTSLKSGLETTYQWFCENMWSRLSS